MESKVNWKLPEQLRETEGYWLEGDHFLLHSNGCRCKGPNKYLLFWSKDKRIKSDIAGKAFKKYAFYSSQHQRKCSNLFYALQPSVLSREGRHARNLDPSFAFPLSWCQRRPSGRTDTTPAHVSMGS